MNLIPCTDPHGPLLLEIIQFKWLMGGAGHRVHVERMQSDADYARHCLALGAGATLGPLRHCAQHLAGSLGLGAPN